MGFIVGVVALLSTVLAFGCGDESSAREDAPTSSVAADGREEALTPPPGPQPPPPPEVPASRRRGGGCWCGAPLPEINPAAIISDPGDSIGSEEMSPVINGWSVASHRRTTFVWAGGNPYDASVGRFVIARENVIQQLPKFNAIEIPEAGPLKIVAAPTGAGVVKTAQIDGKLRFTTMNGISGVLDLKDDSITLNPS